MLNVRIKLFQRVLMLDMNETIGISQADRLNDEFGRNRATFTKCDVTKGSEFDGEYVYKIIYRFI